MSAAPPTAAAAAAPDRATLALILLIFGATLLGISGIFVRLSEVGPIATGFYRMALALPALLLWQALFPAPPAQAKPGRRDWLWLLAAGFFFAGDLAIWHWSLVLTSVANATLIGNTAPIFVTLAAWLMLGQRPTRLFLGGLAVAMAGTVTLIAFGAATRQGALAGDLLALAAALFWAGYIMAVARTRERFGTGTAMLGISCVTAVLLLPMAWIGGENLLPATIKGWLLLIGFALMCQVIGQSTLTFGLAHLTPALSSVILLLQPVSAAVLAWIILGERVGPMQALGGVAVMAGIYLARRGSR